MKIIALPRGGGKTREAIKLAHEEKATIICAHYGEVEGLQFRAMQLGLEIPRPCCFTELIARRIHKDELYIFDNIEYILRSFLELEQENIIAITVNTND